MTIDTKHLRRTFNTSAEWYDQIRPGYPEELIEDVIALSAIPRDGRILEIGCGTGKATENFASRGYKMICLDIGADLVAVAKQKFHESANIQIVVSSFEEWKPDDRSFDLVIAAASFHWVDPAVAYVKSAAVLKSNGSLAVFGNSPIRNDEGFFLRVQDIYRACAPSIIDTKPIKKINSEEPDGMELFGEPIVRCYRWSTEYSSKEYIDLLGTYSDHISLPAEKRIALFSGIASLIDREYDGNVLKHYEAVLQLHKKKQ